MLLLAPELILLATALVVIAADLLMRRKRKAELAYVALAGTVLAAFATVPLAGQRAVLFGGALVVDPFAVFLKLVLLATTALIILASVDLVTERTRWQGEFYALLLLATLGMLTLVSATELVTLYIALEVGTMGFAALVAFLKQRNASAEAGLKYLLLAAFSSGVLLYGIALLYGATGSTHLAVISQRIAAPLTMSQPAVLLALTLLVAGFGFKLSAVPFQMWVPDVYEGAPTPVTVFLAVVSKVAGFGVALRLFAGALGQAEGEWTPVIAALAALTMTVGNLGALGQGSMKRLLAYSSIGQAGYLLVGLAAAAKSATVGAGTTGVLYFLVAYAFTNLGAFVAVIVFSNQTGSDRIADYAGLARRSPGLALALGICLLSLVGMPPTAGFVGKFYLFYTAAAEGLVWLVGLAVVNTAISMYYYMRPIKLMYLDPAPSAEPVRTTLPLTAALAGAVAAVFAVALVAGPLIDTARGAAELLTVLR
ncbi:MAG: NADH-quinone oxidoreductase subunit N [Chloroflexi bacterium]|nr:NADH-quinone oxidoreductase subunit N [Chloroflexota bacterium]